MRSQATLFGVFFIVWGFTAPVGANEFRFEAYGDSLTAGFVSDTNVTNVQAIKPVSRIVSDMAMFAITQKPDYMKRHIHKDLAWPNQLAKLVSRWGKVSEVVNLAYPGDCSWDMKGQVEAAPATQASVRAFFFVGHNDLMYNLNSPDKTADTFISHIAAAAQAWDERHSNSTLYLLPVGGIPSVYRTLEGYQWYRSDKGHYQCEDSWQKLFAYGRWYHELMKKGQLESHVGTGVSLMNIALKQLASKWNSRSTNRMEFVSAIEAVDHRPEYFAVDCFHLSAQGQQEMAQQLHNALTF